ncbi:MAG: hypothetical protein ACXVRX_02890 [Solirubrobacteraceae bacterium]
MRSAFVQWPVLVGRGTDLVADLKRHTALDTLELSDFTFDWDATQHSSQPEEPGRLAVAATDAFGDLPVPLAEPAEYARLHHAVEQAAAGGFAIACNITPFYLSDLRTAPLGCVDVEGRRVPGLRRGLGVYGCPSRPEIAAHGEAKARAFVASWPALDVLTINHAEFPLWPQTRVEEVLTCFCETCWSRAAAMGLDLAEVIDALDGVRAAFGPGVDTGALRAAVGERPALARWLAFRRDAVSECVERIVAAARDEAQARGRQLAVGLEAQLPALAPLVGTDVARLARTTDFVVAKFPDYLPAAILPWLASELGGEDDGPLLAAMRETLALGRGPERYEPVLDPAEGLCFANAFDAGVFDLQLPLLAAARAEGPVYAYLWKYGGDDADLGEKLQLAARHGFDGYFLWVWNRDLQHDALPHWPDTLPTIGARA